MFSVQKNKIKFSTESEYNINRFGKLLNNLGLNDHNIKNSKKCLFNYYKQKLY